MSVFSEILEESFVTISCDKRFRIYANPKNGLVELEEMDSEGDVADCVASSMFFPTGTDAERKRAVLRFLGFVERWDEQFEGSLSRDEALQAFDSMFNLALISIRNSIPTTKLNVKGVS